MKRGPLYDFLLVVYKATKSEVVDSGRIHDENQGRDVARLEPNLKPVRGKL